MPATLHAADNPHPGMLAIVRNRRGIISEVRPFAGDEGVLHLVTLEYKDDGAPLQEELIWECEPHRQLLRPHALPQASDPMMEQSDFDALLCRHCDRREINCHSGDGAIGYWIFA